MNFLRIRFISSIFVICLQFIIAAPSGGPYGPVKKNYEIPETDGKIYYVSPDGVASNTGESVENPTTIENAISKVKTGDVIILRGGIYRTGNLLLNQGVTIQPYKEEQPVFKGTYVAKDWQDLGNGIWKTSWKHLFPMKPQDWWRRDREGKKTPQHRFNNDMVFAEGKFLQSAGWEGELDENSYYIDYETGTVYIGTNPENKLIEITSFDVAIHRVTKEVHGKQSDKKGYVLKGIKFMQYAYRALEVDGMEPEGVSPEDRHGKDVIGTVIDNCEISFCSRVAAYLRGDNLILKNCKISDTSTEGIYVIASNDVLLEKNIFLRNNIENITGYYPAAVKIFNQCYRVVCNDNYVTEQPNSNGIWYDVGNVDGVFTNNWIENIGNKSSEFFPGQVWPSDNGFFFEISKGVICAGNVFVNCDHGMLILNSNSARIYNNTFVNSTACIGRDARSAQGDHFGWHPATGPDVDERMGHVFVNNLLAGDENYSRPLLFVWQSRKICDRIKDSQLKEFNNNVYVNENKNESLILWGPAENSNCRIELNNLDQITKMYPAFETESKHFFEGINNIFVNSYQYNYNLQNPNNYSLYAKKIPENIGKLLKTGAGDKYIGAYK